MQTSCFNKKSVVVRWRNFLGVLFLFCICSTVYAQINPHHNASFAIVELYTSEGCSSCPPADIVLSKLTDLQKSQGLPIYTLSFHVDYWNYLGWKDPFSEEQFSQRQRRYAWANNSDTVYTPQMIINGLDNFSGYKEDRARQAIDHALSQKSTVQIDVDARTLSKDQIELKFNISQVVPDAVLNVALVETGLVSHVTKGENTGRTLLHSNVVRIFKTVPINKLHGSLKLKLPASIKKENILLIAYVQNSKTMVILGANRSLVVF